MFAPLITRITTLYFHEEIFPSTYKAVSAEPLLKKEGLDLDNVTYYRPISNLQTISKIVERLTVLVTNRVEQATDFNLHIDGTIRLRRFKPI